MGVSIRATTKEANTASAAVHPNCLKNLPGTPLMKAVGKNTATKVKVVAITAKPISSAASIAALNGVLPMCKWRSMFSTSTIASSTKIPTTNDSASKLMTLMEKPRYHMPMNAGMTDKGRATAETNVARKSRKNNQTTSTANKAPSYSNTKDAWYSSSTGVTKSNAVVISTSGWLARNSVRAFCTAAPTSTSLAPRLRAISKPTTGLPFKYAAERCSAMVSLTWAMSRKRMRPPCPTESSKSASSAAEPTVAKVRMGCSLPPKSVRPPALSLCTCLSCRDTSAAVMRKACMRTGSKEIATSRCTPPTRDTAPTPLTDNNRRVTV